MLHKKMRRTDFAFEVLLSSRGTITSKGRSVVLAHVLLESLTICVGRWLPAD